MIGDGGSNLGRAYRNVSREARAAWETQNFEIRCDVALQRGWHSGGGPLDGALEYTEYLANLLNKKLKASKSLVTTNCRWGCHVL